MIPALFFAFLRVGLFALGGGATLLPLLEAEIVRRHAWLTAEEFVELLGLTQALPGAISVKFATYVGFKVAGAPGVAAAMAGVLLPPFLFIVALIALLDRAREWTGSERILAGVLSVTVGLLFAFALDMARRTEMADPLALGLAAAAFAAFLLGVHPAFIIVAGAVLGVMLFPV